MIVYEQEKKDGLEDLILSKGSITFESEIRPSVAGIAKASASDPDVFYIESILASVGWNDNDDIFTRSEIWNARNTPVHKKFNYMHNEKDIIGTITKAFVLDKDGKLIPDDTKEEDLPEFFEIGVGSVLYTYWEDPELKARAKKLTEEILEDKWFVSMEVLFPSFDYSVTKGSEQKFIQRNEETSFLTKYLRSYGGTGEYQGWKLGRQLKGIFFSGKGLVNNPANKRSLITLVGFNGAKASVDTLKEVKMSVEQKDYDKAVAEAGALSQKLETSQAQINNYKLQVESLTKEVEVAKALSTEQSAKISELESVVAESNQKLTEVNKSFAEVLEQVKSEKRVNQLVSVGVESAKAEELVKTFASANDEMFAKVVELNKKEPTPQSDKVEDATKKIESAVASKTDVEQSSPILEADLTIAKASEFLGSFFKNGNKK